MKRASLKLPVFVAACAALLSGRGARWSLPVSLPVCWASPEPSASGAAAAPPAAGSSIGPDDALDRHEADDDEAPDPFYEEWNQKMEGFHPNSLLSLDVAPKGSEVFYENVRHSGTLLRGMYYTLSKEDDLMVKLSIKSPSGDVVYSKEASDGIFAFDAKLPGVYEFEFSNSNWLTPVGITLAVGSEEHSVLQSRHIQSTQSRLQQLKTHVDSIYAQFKYLWLHNHRQMRISRDAQRHLLLHSVVQFLVVTVCSVICITYVKRIVSNKRIL